MIKVQRGLEIAGRATLLVSKNKAAWVAGTTLLSFAKILENMEIGHNVLHGQWDWMRDPDIHSTTWEWDFVTPARVLEAHPQRPAPPWTNVVGKDNDVGLQPAADGPRTRSGSRCNLGNPLYNALLAPGLRVGHRDLRPRARATARRARSPRRPSTRDLKALGRKALTQFTKDYAATPAVAMLTGSGKQALSAPSPPTRSATSGPTR